MLYRSFFVSFPDPNPLYSLDICCKSLSIASILSLRHAHDCMDKQMPLPSFFGIIFLSPHPDAHSLIEIVSIFYEAHMSRSTALLPPIV